MMRRGPDVVCRRRWCPSLRIKITVYWVNRDPHTAQWRSPCTCGEGDGHMLLAVYGDGRIYALERTRSPFAFGRWERDLLDVEACCNWGEALLPPACTTALLAEHYIRHLSRI